MSARDWQLGRKDPCRLDDIYYDRKHNVEATAANLDVCLRHRHHFNFSTPTGNPSLNHLTIQVHGIVVLKRPLSCAAATHSSARSHESKLAMATPPVDPKAAPLADDLKELALYVHSMCQYLASCLQI